MILAGKGIESQGQLTVTTSSLFSEQQTNEYWGKISGSECIKYQFDESQSIGELALATLPMPL